MFIFNIEKWIFINIIMNNIKELQAEYDRCWVANKGDVLEKLLSLGFIEYNISTKQYPIFRIEGNKIIGTGKRPTKTEIKVLNLKHELKLRDGFFDKK